ncbi:MAG: pantetheine-phosphate adenylyltransferase [Chloroflexi bacterium]|nr:MAG: pantetheine-phosphate adenylyltransferase [Chloroflexota bacterium]
MVRAVFPGTFDPIHYGHVDIVTRASRLFDELIIAVYDRPLKSLLFLPEERLSLVRQSFDGNGKIKVLGYSGLTVDFCRKINAQVIVRGLRVFSDFEYEFRMALANHRLAPEIDVVALITNEEHTFLSSTTVREIASLGGDTSTMVPPHVEEALRRRFKELGDGQQVVPTNSMRD